MAASCAFGFGNEDGLLAAPPRFERDGQHAFHRAHRAIQRQLADEAEFLERRAIQLFADRDHAERDRQIEARSFLLNVGRREIDRRSSARPEITAVADRRRDAVAALLHGGVGQPNDDDVRIASGAVDLDFDFIGIDAIDRGGINLCQHEGGNVWENARNTGQIPKLKLALFDVIQPRQSCEFFSGSAIALTNLAINGLEIRLDKY